MQNHAIEGVVVMDFSQWLIWLQKNVALEQAFYHNPVGQWLIALGTVCVLIIVLPIAVVVVRKRVEALAAHRLVRFDRAHFAKFGDSALIYEVVYYVLSADFNLYMDIQQAINLQLFNEFATRKIEFAFPTQTVHLFHESTPGQSSKPE